MKELTVTLGALTLGVTYALVMSAILPILRLFFGVLGGWFVQVTVGAWLVKGAAPFGLVIPVDHIWAIAAFLAFVGGFFQPPAVKAEAQAYR